MTPFRWRYLAVGVVTVFFGILIVMRPEGAGENAEWTGRCLIVFGVIFLGSLAFRPDAP